MTYNKGKQMKKEITKENCDSYFQHVPNNAEGIRWLYVLCRTGSLEKFKRTDQKSVSVLDVIVINQVQIT